MYLHAFSDSTVRSQLGPDDCVDNVTISTSDVRIFVPPGTVCIECSVGGVLATDAVFTVDTSAVDESIGRVVDGVLVVSDTESVFITLQDTDVTCESAELNTFYGVGIFLMSKSYC